MAKIQEEIIVIKISQLVKNDDESAPRATAEVVAALAQVAEELVGAGAVVEIEQA
jgi:hypothetical protein